MYLVAASGTIGLERREDMCRLEFSVCVWSWGEGRINVAVECHTQYRHKPSSVWPPCAVMSRDL